MLKSVNFGYFGLIFDNGLTTAHSLLAMPKRAKNWKLIRKDWPRVYSLIHHGNLRFITDSRKTGFAEGKREMWKSEAEALASAETIADQKQTHGTASFAELLPVERRDAAEALELLRGTGATLLDAARVFIRERERELAAAHSPTVEEAVNAYINAKRIEEAAGEIERLTLREIESKMRIVKAEFGPEKVTNVDGALVREWIRRLPHRPQGKKNILTKTVQFFNYAKNEGKWISANPAEGITITVKNGDVSILAIQEVKTLLEAAIKSDNSASVIPYLAVQLFAGLRPFEAERLDWSRVYFGTNQIEVLGETSKTGETRYVKLEPGLIAWLKPFRENQGRIIGPFFVETLRAVKEAAGFTFGDDDTRPWPKDVLRHCFGSYWLAVHKDRAHLAEEMGNSVAVIKRRYRKAIPEEIAKGYWKILPKLKKGQIAGLQKA